jgi:hypothetical protein
MDTSTSLLFTIGYSFLFWDASSNVHYGYAVNFTMNDAWLRLAAQAFLKHVYKLHELNKFPTPFTQINIHKQKIKISTK